MAWKITSLTTVGFAPPISSKNPLLLQQRPPRKKKWLSVTLYEEAVDLFCITSLLEIPLINWNTKDPEINLQEALALRIEGKTNYIYLWYTPGLCSCPDSCSCLDSSSCPNNLIPQLWVLQQPIFNPGSNGATVSMFLNSPELFPAFFNPYFIQNINKIAPSSPPGSTVKLSTIRNNSTRDIVVSFPPCVWESVKDGTFIRSGTFCSNINQNVNVVDLNPLHVSSSSDLVLWFFISRYFLPQGGNAPSNCASIPLTSKTIYVRGLVYDLNGNPYLASRIPITANLGQTLRMHLVERTDGIVLLGTMDLDPSDKPCQE